jgi:hypothetical protein
MVPLPVEVIFPVTVLKLACGGHVGVALAEADVLALAVPHPASSTLAIMTQNAATTTEIRRLGARMQNSSGPLADLADLANDESWRIESAHRARHDHIGHTRYAIGCTLLMKNAEQKCESHRK